MSASIRSANDGGSPRTIVLCFDGTGNLYDGKNTNIVKLFALLKKDNKDEQLVYYQAGIGTYSAPGIMASMLLCIAKELDVASAWYLDAHVMGGYQFLMQNYRSGDRICLFGFSRGAYTARALAGMLYKVGLLPKDNKEQIGFAYKIYHSTGKKNRRLAFGFKQTFSRTVQIEFMGCWDTVSSVGLLWSRHLPFTSSNTIIKCFRHALSLDEHRAKFQPNLWHREAPDRSAAHNDPEQGSYVPDHDAEKGDASEPPDAKTDVLEVWFAGCHSDVGGGETPSNTERSLSNVSLRWMVREIIASQCGIQFDNAALVRAEIPLSTLSLQIARAASKAEEAMQCDSIETEHGVGSSAQIQLRPVEINGYIAKPQHSPASGDLSAQDALDAVQPLHDELKLTPIWWVLEVVPLSVSWQDDTGIWHRTFKWNLGRGRTIPITSPNLHITVQERIGDKSLVYTPKAMWTNKPNATWVT